MDWFLYLLERNIILFLYFILSSLQTKMATHVRYNALLRPNLRWKVLKYECKYETETSRISAKTEQ
jgi:hypothetical protein